MADGDPAQKIAHRLHPTHDLVLSFREGNCVDFYTHGLETIVLAKLVSRQSGPEAGRRYCKVALDEVDDPQKASGTGVFELHIASSCSSP